MDVRSKHILDISRLYPVLRLTLRNGEIKESDVPRSLMDWEQLKPRLDLLVENGVLDRSLTDSGHIHKVYRLTDKGYAFTLALGIASGIFYGEITLGGEDITAFEEMGWRTDLRTDIGFKQGAERAPKGPHRCDRIRFGGTLNARQPHRSL